MDKDSFLVETAKKFLNALDGVLEKGPWEKTIFLRAAGKSLRELRARMRAALGENVASDESTTAKTLADRIAQRVGQQEVYIYLYNADGHSLAKWGKLISTLRSQSVSRPIYEKEADVQELIRSKIQKINEGYVALYINKTDIVEPVNTAPPKDKIGNALLMVKDQAVKAENVTRFVHSSGQYIVKGPDLIRQGDTNYMDFT